MYNNFDEYLYEAPARKIKDMVFSCNCKTPNNLITMHVTKADGDGKCVLCGHYAYKIEKHILNAKRSVLHKVL